MVTNTKLWQGIVDPKQERKRKKYRTYVNSVMSSDPPKDVAPKEEVAAATASANTSSSSSGGDAPIA
jgi:hypothetical protein